MAGLHNFSAGESAMVAENLDLNFQYLLSLIQGNGGNVSTTGTASGSSSCQGFSQHSAATTGTATGTSTAFGISGSKSTRETVGTASGTSTAPAVGSSQALVTGTASGNSNCVGFSENIGNTAGTASGNSSAIAVGGANIASQGSASGTSSATAAGSSLAHTKGTATGMGSAVAVGSGSASEASDGDFVSVPSSTLFGSTNPGTSGGALSSFGLTASPGLVTINGTPDNTTTNSVMLYYHNHTMFVLNSDDVWKQWGGSAGSWPTASDPRTLTIFESVEGFDVTTTSNAIYASSTPGTAASSTATVGNGLDKWTLTGNPGQIAKNGVVDGTTANVVQLYYHNHFVYQQASNNFWHWDGSTWVDDGATSPVPATPTLNIARLDNQFVGAVFEVSGSYQDYTTGAGTYATPGNGSITDVNGNVWTIDATTTEVLENGTPVPQSSGTGAIDYFNNTIYGQDAASGAWFTFDETNQVWNAASAPGNLPSSGGSAIPTLQYQDAGSSTWNDFPSTTNVTNDIWKFVHPAVLAVNSSFSLKIRDKNNTGLVAMSNTFQIFNKGVVTLTGISIDNTSVTSGQAAGTLVGHVTVGVAGGSFTGTFAITGTDAAKFTMSGNQLQTAVVLDAGTYSITITASQSGATGSPQTLNVTVTASAESPQGTSVTSGGATIIGSSTPGSPGAQDTWTFTGVSPNFDINLNGITQNGTTGAKQMYYINHTFYYQTSQNAWLKFNGTITNQQAGFTSTSSPIPLIDIDGSNVSTENINVTNSQAPVGTNGNLTLVSAGSNLSGATWSITGTDAAKFAIVGGNKLETAGALPVGTYHITLNATLT